MGMSKQNLKATITLKWVMILTCIVSICSGLYVDFLRAYKSSILRICVVCTICFFTYKKKRAAEIGYYLFSGLVILAGIVSIIIGVIKLSRGILPGVRYETIITYIVRAIFQIGFLYTVVQLKRQKPDFGGIK